MELIVAGIAEVSTIRLIGQLWERDDLRALEESIDACIENSAVSVVIDVSRLTFVSSQGLGLLVRYFGKLRDIGGALIIYGPRSNVLETIEVSGFDMFMKIARTEEDLKNALGNSDARSASQSSE